MYTESAGDLLKTFCYAILVLNLFEEYTCMQFKITTTYCHRHIVIVNLAVVYRNVLQS